MKLTDLPGLRKRSSHLPPVPSQADFAGLVERYQGPLFGFLGRMGFGQAEAEDLAQNTFLRAWQSLGQFNQTRGAFSTWLFAIARNLAIDERHRSGRQPEAMDGAAPDDTASPQAGPEELLARARQHRRVHAALLQLAVADRCVLALAYIAELDMDSIARIEGCTVGAVKTRLHRARQRLFELLATPL